jgi:hypothetical protein
MRAGMHSWPSSRITSESMAAATCHAAGRKTRGSAAGHDTASAQEAA